MESQLPKLYLNKQRVSKKTGKTPLYFKHEYLGKPVRFQQKFKVDPNDWNQDLQRVENDSTLSARLKEIRESWRVRFSMGKEENSSIEELQLIFQESINKGAKKQSSKLKVRFTFYDLLDKYME